jgi:hypothetical protein
VFTFRVAAERSLRPVSWLRLSTRAGYGLDPTPAPSQPGLTNYVDSTRHTFTAGFGVGFGEADAHAEPVQLDLGASFTHFRPREVRKDDPADPVGDYRAEGTVWGLTASLRVQLGP